jgi:hypothetical protein
MERSIDGLLFFRGGRRFYACVAHNVAKGSAQLYSDGLGLLPLKFFVTFDSFQSVSICQLVWRHRDHIGVVFDRCVDLRPMNPYGTFEVK